MYVSSCINPEIPFLQPEDKGLTALGLMEELKLSEIPLVQNDAYVGLLNEMDLLDYECIDGQLSDIQAEIKKPFVLEDDHIFEAIGIMVSESLSVLPVISKDGEKYIGAIDHLTILNEVGKGEAFHSPGGVLEFELNIHDYSLSEISRLVESNDAKILYSDVISIPDSEKIKVTIKLNKSDLTRIMQTFNRFGYTITASFHKNEYEEDLRKRYDGFLRYLNT